MPRKTAAARTEYNNAWNDRNKIAAARHRVKANEKHCGLPGSPQRTAYNERKAREKRNRRALLARRAAMLQKLEIKAKEEVKARKLGYHGRLNLERI